jgi:transposase
VSTSSKESVTTQPRDIPYGPDRLELLWHKHRWRCHNSDCPRATFTDAVPQVPPRRRTTGRLRSAVAHAVECNRGVAEVAAAHGVGWTTAQACVDEYTAVVLTEPEPTPVLGIDETRRGKPVWEFDTLTRRWRRVDRWHTGFVDLSGEQGLLRQAAGRRSVTVTAWLCQRSQAFRDGVRYVVIDPAAAYRAATSPALLPNAFRLTTNTLGRGRWAKEISACSRIAHRGSVIKRHGT